MVTKMTQVEFLQPSTKQTIILTKDRIDWQIEEPISWPAEPISIANLVSKISHLDATFICYLEELESRGEIPADYGFDENSSSLHLLIQIQKLLLHWLIDKGSNGVLAF